MRGGRAPIVCLGHNFHAEPFKKPAADAEAGHRATTVCHLINICRQLGRKLQWDPKAERFVNDREADHLISRPRREGYELPVI